MNQTPPFRADHVGSILRSKPSRTRAPNARRTRLARLLAEEEHWAKLRMLVELADEVCGK